MMNKTQGTIVYLLLLGICGGVVYHDYTTSGSLNIIFIVILAVITIVYLILLLKKPKKRAGYIDAEKHQEELNV